MYQSPTEKNFVDPQPEYGDLSIAPRYDISDTPKY